MRTRLVASLTPHASKSSGTLPKVRSTVIWLTDANEGRGAGMPQRPPHALRALDRRRGAGALHTSKTEPTGSCLVHVIGLAEFGRANGVSVDW